jgi:hypothetical protein
MDNRRSEFFRLSGWSKIRVLGMIVENKLKALCVLVACVGICVAVVLSPSTDTLMPFLIKLISQTTTISLALIFAFDRWLWKYLPEWLLGVPKIYGTWKGRLDHSQCTEDGLKQTGTTEPFFVCIHQNFCSLMIQAVSEKSVSISTVANLKKGFTDWEIIYAYDNAPALQHQAISRRHRGAATLQIQSSGNERKLVGEYWTDRWSQGQMTLDRYSKRCVTNFIEALKISP